MNNRLKRSLAYVFWGGVSTSAVDTLVVGPTLFAYAAFFGAGDIAFGILGAVPYFGNLAHLFSAWLIEHGFSIRKTAFYTAFISRFFLLIAALLAFKPNMPGALEILILILTLNYLIGCISGGVWLPWMKTLIPARIMGRFFSFRFKYMMVAKVICFWFSALLLKYGVSFVPQDKEIYIYAFLFIIAFIIGLFSAWTLSQVEDKKQVSVSNSLSFIQKVKTCLMNKPFRNLLFTLSFTNFTVAFITPFVTVFMLKYLEIPMSTILIFTLIMQLTYTLVIKKLGKIADKEDTLKVLKLSVPLLLLSLLGFLIINQFTLGLYTTYAVLIIAHIILGIATAGIALGINNASLIYVPNESSAIYLSVNSVVKSFAGVVASILAGVTLSLCTLLETSFANRWTVFWSISVFIAVVSYYTIIVFKSSLKKGTK